MAKFLRTFTENFLLVSHLASKFRSTLKDFTLNFYLLNWPQDEPFPLSLIFVAFDDEDGGVKWVIWLIVVQSEWLNFG